MVKNKTNVKKLTLSILIPLIVIFSVSLYVIFGIEESTDVNIVDDYQPITVEEILSYSLEAHIVEMSDLSSNYRVFFTTTDASNYVNDNGKLPKQGAKLIISDKLDPMWQKITPNDNTVVIYPIFTAAAYNEPGFYTHFRGECDERCVTNVSFEKPPGGYTSSMMATQIFNQLGYSFITDIDVDRNPEILKNYDTIILLHNEYVTQKMFDAVVSHPNIIYLYPNALYAEITVNYDDNTMTLIRGHNYPEFEIKNGFDYEIEERFHEYEYDSDCLDWEFVEFENGHALTCYPDNVIYDTLEIIQKLKELK